MKRNKEYEFKKEVAKDDYISDYVRKYEGFMRTMFTYEGLPETIDTDFMERCMFYDGAVVFAEIPNGKNQLGEAYESGVYAFRPNFADVFDNNGNPTKNINISVFLNYNKIERFNDTDGIVLMKNNEAMLPTVHTVNRYAIYQYDNDMSLNMNIILSRIPYIISASDDDTKNSAMEFIKSIIKGDYSIIGENTFLDGIKVNPVAQTSNTIVNYVEALQYYKGSLLHELGVNANYNMKRESLNDGEIDVNVDALIPIVNDMYEHRKEAIEVLNRRFGISASVTVNSPWNYMEKAEEVEETDENEPETDPETDTKQDENEPETDEKETDKDEDKGEVDE